MTNGFYHLIATLLTIVVIQSLLLDIVSGNGAVFVSIIAVVAAFAAYIAYSLSNRKRSTIDRPSTVRAVQQRIQEGVTKTRQ